VTRSTASAAAPAIAARNGNNVELRSSFVGVGAVIIPLQVPTPPWWRPRAQGTVAGTTGTVAFTVTGDRARPWSASNTDTDQPHVGQFGRVAQINGVTSTTSVTAARSGNNVVLTSGAWPRLLPFGRGPIAPVAAGTQASVAGTNGTSNDYWRLAISAGR
jgi:hypothetical protein